MHNGIFRGRAVSAFALAGMMAASPATAATVSDPAVSGPVASTAIPGDPSHNYIFFASNDDLAVNGYVEEKFFVTSSASRYDVQGLATGVVRDGGHPYATRIVVRRPADPKRFNGTVVVEWYNVTNGFDAENLWFFGWEHLIRAGYVWVGVSPQHVGVDALKAWSPGRYGELDVGEGGRVSDDALSYDIFSQAGEALRHPGTIDMLHGLKPRVMLATGKSQSAVRLSSYVNAVHPFAKVYDGFLLLSAVGNAIRPDLISPVWKILTEYDVAAGEAAVRQPDSDKFRSWEIAGTSHVDQHLRAGREPLELRDLGTSSEAALHCDVPSIGTRVPTSYVLASAFDQLVRWAKGGAPPPAAPRIQVKSVAARPAMSVIARDGTGLALGGIRLAELMVPTGMDVGVNKGPGVCVRWSYSAPFDIVTLDARYPSHAAYVAAVADVTRDNLKHRYIVPADAETTIREAEQSRSGFQEINKRAEWN